MYASLGSSGRSGLLDFEKRVKGEIKASSFTRSNTCWLQIVNPVVVIAIKIVTKTLTKLRARRQDDWSSADFWAASNAVMMSWSFTFSGWSDSRWRKMADPLDEVSFHLFSLCTAVHSCVYTVNIVCRCARHEDGQKSVFFHKILFF